MGTLSEVEEDFIEETLDILTELCRSCGELESAASVKEGCRNIQRGLHTIKGNSPAFGFEEFGEVASALLERVKVVAHSGMKEESRTLAPLVLEFVTRSRQYLGLVREGRSRPLFGGIFKSLRDQLSHLSPSARPSVAPAGNGSETHGQESAEGTSRGSDPGGEADRPTSKSRPSLKSKLETILAGAPPVQPNLEQLSKLAARRLKLRSERAVAAERPRPAPAGRVPGEATPNELLVERVEPAAQAVQSAGSDPVGSAAPVSSPSRMTIAPVEAAPRQVEVPASSEVASLAIEALRAREAAAMVSAEIERNPDLRRQMARVVDFLDDFCSWARGRQMVPLQKFLDRCVDDLRALASRSGLDVEIAAERTSRPTLPLLGELVEQAITELLRGLSLLWKRDQGHRSLTLNVPESSDRVEIRISGAGSPAALATRLRVYSVKRRLEEIGGALVTGSAGEDLVVVLPEHLHSIEVCLLRSGETHVGVPGHRVIASLEIQRQDVRSTGSEYRCRFEDGEIAVLDLTESTPGDASDGREERCLVVLCDGKQRHGLIVDEFLGRREMLVRLDAGFSQGSDIVGSCFAVSEEQTVPLVDFKAAGRAVLEGHGS